MSGFEFDGFNNGFNPNENIGSGFNQTNNIDQTKTEKAKEIVMSAPITYLRQNIKVLSANHMTLNNTKVSHVELFGYIPNIIDKNDTTVVAELCDGTGSIEVMHYLESGETSPLYTAHMNYVNIDLSIEQGKYVRIVGNLIGLKNEEDEEFKLMINPLRVTLITSLIDLLSHRMFQFVEEALYKKPAELMQTDKLKDLSNNNNNNNNNYSGMGMGIGANLSNNNNNNNNPYGGTIPQNKSNAVGLDKIVERIFFNLETHKDKGVKTPDMETFLIKEGFNRADIIAALHQVESNSEVYKMEDTIYPLFNNRN